MNAPAFRAVRLIRPQAPSQRQRIDRRMLAIATVMLVVGGHVVWYKVASHMVISYSDVGGDFSQAPVVSYLGPSESRADAPPDVRLIRSPILFAMPMSVGFSGPQRGKANVSDEPMLPRRIEEFIRPADQDFQAGEFGETARDLVALVTSPRAMALPPLEPMARALLAQPPSGGPQLLAYWLDQPGDPLPLEASQVGVELASSEPWEAIVYLCVEGPGWVQQALMEKAPSAREAIPDILRMSRSIAVLHPPVGSCGRLMLKYRPAPRGEASL